MKFLFIQLAIILSFSVFCQEEEQLAENKWYSGSFIIEGSADMLVSQGDFGQKLDKNIFGFSYGFYKQLYAGRFFLGLNFNHRRLDKYVIEEFYDEVDQQTISSNFMTALATRVYPEFLISIVEFWFEGGAGLNVMYSYTNFYDNLAEESYNQTTNNLDTAPVFYGAAGLHIPINDFLLITASTRSYFGTTIKFDKELADPGYVDFSDQAFELKTTSFRATGIHLGISFIF